MTDYQWWRREGDSNPRSREAQRFSRPSQSSALPSLRRAAYRRRPMASGAQVASGPEERWPSLVEGAPLLREYGSKTHRGFESHPLRHSNPSRSQQPAVDGFRAAPKLVSLRS